jgi:hypothetical protein
MNSLHIKRENTSHHFKMGHNSNYEIWKRGYGALAEGGEKLKSGFANPSVTKSEVQNLVAKNRHSNIAMGGIKDLAIPIRDCNTVHKQTYRWI